MNNASTVLPLHKELVRVNSVVTMMNSHRFRTTKHQIVI